MLFRGIAFVLLCSACGFQHGEASRDASGQPMSDGDPNVVDAEVVVDAMVDAPVGFCYGTFKQICFTSMPTGDYSIQATTQFDTDNDGSCSKIVTQAGGPAICVVAAANISIQGNVGAKGTRALAFVATGAFSNGATLDVGSYYAQNAPFKGAGVASGALCGSPTAGAADNNGANSGAGGGAGGSFGGAGGNGATGRNGAGGAGGTAAAAAATPTILRGGCDGTSGGNGGNGAGGAGGFGGGAIYIVANTSITNGGTIRSSGQGGVAGGTYSGGGGGGAGGMIVLDSPSINNNSGFVIANGGGGGEGGGQTVGGENGASGLTAGRAAGGSGAINGGDGGAGGGGGTANGDPGATGTNGAGGGGGGVGVIRVFRGTISGTVSPSPT